MKTAILFGVAGVAMLAACGGTQGTTEGVGQSAAAVLAGPLSGTSNPADLGTSPSQQAIWSSSCAFYDGVDSYFVKAGGYDTLSIPTNKIWMLKRGNGNSWVTQTATLSTARGESQVYQISDTQCVIVGGSTSATGTPSAAVDILTLSSGTVTVSNVHALQQGRYDFKLSTCKDSGNAIHLVAVMGKGSVLLDDIEVSPAIANLNATNTWTQTTGYFATARKDFGLDTNGSGVYMAAGGDSGTYESSIELFKLDSNCAVVGSTSTLPSTFSSLSAISKGLIVAYDATNGKFVATGGTTKVAGVDTLWHDQNSMTVTSSPLDVTARTTTTPNTDAYRPTFVRIDASKFELLGGANAAVTSSLSTARQYSAGSWDTPVTLNAGVYGGSAALLPHVSEVYIAAGDATLGTRGTVVDGVTP